MTRIAVAAALAACLLGSTAAVAQVTINESCIGSRGARSCSTTFIRPGGSIAKTIEIPQVPDAARDERISAWEAYCRPQVKVDSLGVSRNFYAHDGCEFGRYE